MENGGFSSRVNLILKRSDGGAGILPDYQRQLDDLFEMLFPGRPNAQIEGDHAALGVLAVEPRLAMMMVGISGHLFRNVEWISKRPDLREVAIQALNLHFRCSYSFQSHYKHWTASGLSPEKLSAMPFWKTSNVFNGEERLVIEYTMSVVQGSVSDDLFERAKAAFGERGVVEMSTCVAWWSLWAMIINATGTDFDFVKSAAEGASA